MKKHNVNVVFFLIINAVLCPISLRAVDTVWTGTSTTDPNEWFDVNNWNSKVPQRTPAPADNATINTGTAIIKSESAGASTFYVGNAELQIIQSGSLITSTAHLARNSNERASAVMNGNAFWQNIALFYIGFAGGSGTLTLSDNAQLANTVGSLGGGQATGAGGNAFVTIKDSAIWTNSSTLQIGVSGTGRIDLDGGLIKAFSVVLAQNSTSTGILDIGGAGTGQLVGTDGTTPIEIKGGEGIAIVVFSHTGAGIFNNPLTGGLAVIQNGSGTTVLGGVNTYTGNTTIDSGVLQITASANLANTAIQGSGTLAIDGIDAFTFSTEQAGGGFNGALRLQNVNSFAFGSDATTMSVLQRGESSVILGQNTIATVAESGSISNLYFEGGRLDLHVNNFNPVKTFVITGTLDARSSGTIRIGGLAATGSASLSGALSFIDASNSSASAQIVGENARQLVDAGALGSGLSSMSYIDASGNAAEGSMVVAYGNGDSVIADAHYDYATLSGTRLADGKQGVFLNYKLTDLAIRNGQTLELSTVGNMSGSMQAVISGSGSVIVKNPGEIILSATNTITGPVHIQDGALVTGGVENAIAQSNAVNIGANSTFATGNYDQTLQNLTGSGTVKIAGGHTLTLKTSGEKTFDGLLDGAGGIISTGAGRLILTADNSTYKGEITLENGNSVLLAPDATLGANVIANAGARIGGAGVFWGNLGLTGAILQVDGMSGGASGTLTVGGTVTLVNSMISFGLYSMGVNDRINITGTLIDGGNNVIDINTPVSGTFTLGNITALKNAEVTIGGQSQPSGARERATMAPDDDDETLLLLIYAADISRALTWTGATSATWDNSDSDWIGSENTTQYASGDRVIFDSMSDSSDAGHREITLAGTQVSVIDMEIKGDGNYKFKGQAGILASPTFLKAGEINDPTGKLTKRGNGALAFENDGANNFTGGIDIYGGRIVFNKATQLGTDDGNSGDAGIHFIESASLSNNADILGAGLSNKVTIGNGKTATIDTGTFSLNYSGTVYSQNSGTLVKNGTGSFILKGDSSGSYTGAVIINQGSILLGESFAGIAGDIKVNANTALGGLGTVLGMISAEGNSTIHIGYADTGNETLTINALRMKDGSTITGNGTVAGAVMIGSSSADKIIADIAAGKTVNISAALTGEGMLSKQGKGTLVYATTESLGHASTEIGEGVIRFGSAVASNAVAHSITLNGTNAWLDLSDAPGFDQINPNDGQANTWGTLKIIGASGNVIGSNDKITLHAGDIGFGIGASGSENKQGMFVVVNAADAVATMSGENFYAGYTILKSGTLNVSNNNQLGLENLNREVILDGGALGITVDGFTSSRGIELRDGGGTIYIADGDTASWTGAITHTGNGAFRKSGGGALVLSGAADNYTGDTIIEGGVLRAGADGVLSRESIHKITAHSTLDLNGFSQTINGLQNNGSVMFNAVVNSTVGVITKTDKLVVHGNASGTGTFVVSLSESAESEVNGARSVELLTVEGQGDFSSFSKAVLDQRYVAGAYEWELGFQGNSLLLSAAMPSPEIPAATVIPTVALLMGHASMDSFSQRLGELRNDGAHHNGLWARGIYTENRIHGKLYRSVNVITHGMQVGADFRYPEMWTEGDCMLLGLFFDYAEAKCHPGSVGDVKGMQHGIGVYTTYLNRGYYFDLVARIDDNNYVVDMPGNRFGNEGDGTGVSIETGYAFNIKYIGRIEPSVKWVYQRYNFGGMRDAFDRSYSYHAVAAMQAQGGVRWSKIIPYDTKSAIAPWLRISGGYEFDTDEEVNISGMWFDNDLGGSLLALDAGISFLLGSRASLYVSGMWTKGKNVDSASASTGVRFAW
jgi:outer membrane autotransporter protein